MNRENLFDFLDSNAVRKHLKKIGYELKPIEVALIV